MKRYYTRAEYLQTLKEWRDQAATRGIEISIEKTAELGGFELTNALERVNQLLERIDLRLDIIEQTLVGPPWSSQKGKVVAPASWLSDSDELCHAKNSPTEP